ncbi:MAG: hypothetical protein O7H41_01900 [Planctomycetota bacterium]|nr:hypothetical protein [Planctomycetota bacterium]
MKIQFLLGALSVIAFGCIMGEKENKPAGRAMGDTPMLIRGTTEHNAERPDGTNPAHFGAADPRAQKDFDDNRDDHEKHFPEFREQSKEVDSTITRFVVPEGEPEDMPHEKVDRPGPIVNEEKPAPKETEKDEAK